MAIVDISVTQRLVLVVLSSIGVVVFSVLNHHHHHWLFPAAITSILVGFVDNELPLLWLSLNSWLTPPYLYIIINGIIITIAASSRFQQHHNKLMDQAAAAAAAEEHHHQQVIDHDHSSSLDFAHSDQSVLLNDPTVETRQDFGTTFVDYDAMTLEIKKIPVVNMPEFVPLEPEMDDNTTIKAPSMSAVAISAATDEEGEDYFGVSDHSTSTTLIRGDSMEFTPEKPPVSARFSHRRTVKGSPAEAGKVLRVSKPKRHDTLESTWKTITEGRSVPLARHLKKSDTWQTQNNAGHLLEAADDLKVKKKSESFVKERENQSTPLTVSSRGSVGNKTIRREPSLSQDELNRRVEAFIKKFNEEMRLQREESLDQYNELVNKRVGAI